MQAESVNQMNETSNLIEFDLKLKRIKRDQYAVSGTVTVKDDVKNGYMVLLLCN